MSDHGRVLIIRGISSPDSPSYATDGLCLVFTTNPSPTPVEWHFQRVLQYGRENPSLVYQVVRRCYPHLVTDDF